MNKSANISDKVKFLGFNIFLGILVLYVISMAIYIHYYQMNEITEGFMWLSSIFIILFYYVTAIILMIISLGAGIKTLFSKDPHVEQSLKQNLTYAFIGTAYIFSFIIICFIKTFLALGIGLKANFIFLGLIGLVYLAVSKFKFIDKILNFLTNLLMFFGFLHLANGALLSTTLFFVYFLQ